jgi:hypothetical protein
VGESPRSPTLRLVVTQGEPPWLPGTVLEAQWLIPLEVVSGEPPWEPGQRLVAMMDEPQKPEADQ